MEMLAHWWVELDWGTVPAWIGSVVTSGAFLIAALVYRRERRDRLRASAIRVYPAARPNGAVVVFNDGESAIHDVLVRVIEDGETERRQIGDYQTFPAHHEEEIRFATGQQTRYAVITVDFTDIFEQRWRHTLAGRSSRLERVT